jgi:hypothetical protein
MHDYECTTTRAHNDNNAIHPTTKPAAIIATITTTIAWPTIAAW